ncbi:hypothetical protein NSE_0099 [Neorickettsia sennetsu str. Miyayama]|uniref:Uncharacterized protein n=1 Tax=Ehrlichia sennetsu (strain ATCC VR-367 / Miyayama) TaxID=222891 RepID=Q2GEU7_EHRS3|nr:hypothetical protein NSE_0099 [Neorickettsia sennetsu str. Miyayama]
MSIRAEISLSQNRKIPKCKPQVYKHSIKVPRFINECFVHIVEIRHRIPIGDYLVDPDEYKIMNLPKVFR